MKLGVYGHGPQSKRYLDPKNWPDGVEVVQLDRGNCSRSGNLDGCIVATAPGYHLDLCLCLLRLGFNVLCEKPIALTESVAAAIMRPPTRPGQLLVAHTNLWDREFLSLPASKSAIVEWRGPERADGSCPAMLDWGPHAWSMALALGTERVSTGKGERRNFVESEGKRYLGARADCYPDHETPMAHMLATFASLIDGGYDWRAEPDFALEVHRRCFKPSG